MHNYPQRIFLRPHEYQLSAEEANLFKQSFPIQYVLRNKNPEVQKRSIQLK